MGQRKEKKRIASISKKEKRKEIEKEGRAKNAISLKV